MSLSDEELQNSIEKGNRVDDTLDSRAYQKVFDALKKEPYQLPVHFADRVISRMEAQGGLSKDYFWFGLGLFVFIVGAVVAALLANFKLNFGALKFISGYPGLFVFGAIFIALIHYIDKLLLNNKKVSGIR
jgi:hypothetical protein